VSLTFHSVLRTLYTEPSMRASYQILVHLATRFQSRRFFFRNQPIGNKNCMWWPCLLKNILSWPVNKHGLHRQFLLLNGRFLKKSSLKPLGQMNRNLVGSIYGRSCIQSAHFMPIHYQTWTP
jgi:hypothetical protein